MYRPLCFLKAVCVIGVCVLAISCEHDQGTVSKTVVVVGDQTPSMREFQARNQEFVSRLIGKLESDDEFYLVPVSGAGFGQARIALYRKMPADLSRFEPALMMAREQLIQEWNAIADSCVSRGPYSNIFDSIAFSKLCFQGKTTASWLVAVSDFRHATPALNIERADTVDVEATIKQLRKLSLVPNLSGVRLAVVSVHPRGKTPQYYQSITRLIRRFAEESHAELVALSSDVSWEPFSQTR